MNGTEQKNHKTALDRVVADTAEAIEGLVKAIEDERRQRHEGDIEAIETARRLVNEERTHRLALADEQRHYVDMADTVIKQAAYILTVNMNAFQDRGFWSRLNWLLTGR